MLSCGSLSKTLQNEKCGECAQLLNFLNFCAFFDHPLQKKNTSSLLWLCKERGVVNSSKKNFTFLETRFYKQKADDIL